MTQEQTMNWMAFTKRLLLADGKISDGEAALLRRAVLAGGVDREEVAFVVNLKHEAREVAPSFDLFLGEILKAVVMKDGRVSDAEAEWLRSVLFFDGKLTRTEAEIVQSLHAELKMTSAGLDKLLADVLAAKTG
jgi:uncharacterized tellurite resistance protein B-like protein